MNLVTRCPTCGTAFRVQRDQLAAHFGTVRCGKCGGVFNGVAALVDEGTERVALDPSPQLGLFDPSRRPAQGAAPAGSEGPLPEFMAREDPRRRAWLWSLLCLAALAALGAQAYRFRSDATAVVPELRPAFEAVCRLAGCTVPLARRPELIKVVSSDMHGDPERQIFVLNGLLRNEGRFAQPYPDIELTLTEAGKPVTRRVLRPAEYLDARAAPRLIAGGIEAGAEEPLRVHIDAKVVKATNYAICVWPHECMKEAKK